MNIDVVPLISFVMITTFTPGPNNISSASMGILHGYRQTVNFLLGIASGFFIIMMACAYLSSTLLTLMPVAQEYLRWIGAGYILWLSASILRSSYSFSESNGKATAFTKGFILQLFNPKVAVYGLTLYSTFLAPVSHRLDYLVFFAALVSMTTFAATSTWALCGAAIKNRLQNDRFRKAINTLLSLLLVYTAVKLSGTI